MWPWMSGFLLSHCFKGLPTNYVLSVFPLPEPVSVSLKADIPQGTTKEMEKKLKQSLGIFFMSYVELGTTRHCLHTRRIFASWIKSFFKK